MFEYFPYLGADYKLVLLDAHLIKAPIGTLYKSCITLYVVVRVKFV
jgi:hypothetical protein